MRTWKQFCEMVGGGLPTSQPNYSRAARPGTGGTTNIGQAHLHLVGSSLQIDTATHSISLDLTPQQLQQLVAEFS